MPRHGNAPGRAPAGREDERQARPIVARELSPEAVRHEARALADYVRRGGSASRWLDSKGFAEADRAAILTAWADVEAEA